MLQTLRISHVLAEDGDWNRVLLACQELGYDKSGIIKNVLQAFFRKHREFYLEYALLDATARGISSSEHFVILRDKTEEELPRYKEAPPNPTPTPLDIVPPLPLEDAYRRKMNTLKIPTYNFVLLRNAHMLHRDSYPQLVGKIIRVHLLEHWETTYLPQIEREQKTDYR